VRGAQQDHDVAWVYTRPGLPVEITAEYENWRRIRDRDGTEGWVYHSLLSASAPPMWRNRNPGRPRIAL